MHGLCSSYAERASIKSEITGWLFKYCWFVDNSRESQSTLHF